MSFHSLCIVPSRPKIPNRPRFEEPTTERRQDLFLRFSVFSNNLLVVASSIRTLHKNNNNNNLLVLNRLASDCHDLNAFVQVYL